MTNERSDWQLGSEAGNHVYMIREDGDFVDVHGVLLCSEGGHFSDLFSIRLPKASRAKACVPRDMNENAKCPVCH